MGGQRSTFARLGLVVARRRRTVLIVSAVLVIAGLGLVPFVQGRLLGLGYDTPGKASYRADQILARSTGFTEQVVLVVSSDRYVARDATFQDGMARATAAVHRVGPDLVVLPPGTPGGGATSADQHVVTATIALRGDAGRRQDDAAQLQKALTAAMPADVRAGVTGNSPLLADLIRVEENDMVKAETVGLPIAAIILLLAFGSGLAAGVPLLLGLSGLFVGFGVVAGFMLFMTFNSFAESLMAMIGIAIGIDYSLLFVRRWREERAQGPDDAAAMVRTLATAGRTIAFSGAILTTSLIPLVITRVPFFGDTSVAVIVVIAVEVLLTLTFLPALLLTLGDRVDTGTLPWRRRAVPTGPSRWERWARGVMRRPVAVLGGGVALLLLAASPALGLKTGVDLNARAMQHEPSVAALTQLEQHFPSAALGPIVVVVHGTPTALRAAQERVRAVVAAHPELTDIAANGLTDDTAIVMATPTVGVDSAAAAHLVRAVRSGLHFDRNPGVQTLVTGVTAQTVDYTQVTNDVTPWAAGATLLLSFVLLLVLFRSPVLAVKAIVMNLLSIAAAFGLTVLVFQQGHGERLLHFTSPGYIQSWMPLSLFMVLFGLSMDYEVFMVSRMREEWLRSGETTSAVARGLSHTGSVVTSAAAIMVAIFASFVLTTIPEMKQMGFGMAVAVLIDATIVRAVLVPAFMRIAGRWNWWMPARLGRLLPSVEGV